MARPGFPASSFAGWVAVASLLVTATARAQDGPLPSQRAQSSATELPGGAQRVEREPITWLAVTGFSVFSLVYLAGIPGTAAVSSAEGSKFSEAHASVMAIPFAGPWLEAGGSVEKQSAQGAPALAALGVLQIVGATLAVVGLVGRDVPASADAARASPPRGVRPEVFVTPSASGAPGGGGLSLRGTL